MTKPAPFDPDYAFDAIADLARVECAKVAQRVVESAAYHAGTSEDQAGGFIAGMMVGSLGSIVAITKPDADSRELRDMLKKHIDYWFDCALTLNKREPLEMDVDG